MSIFLDIIESIGDTISNGVNNAISEAASAIEDLNGLLGDLGSDISVLLSVIEDIAESLLNAFNNILDIMQYLFDNALDLLFDILNFVRNLFDVYVIGPIKKFFFSIIDAVYSLISRLNSFATAITSANTPCDVFEALFNIYGDSIYNHPDFMDLIECQGTSSTQQTTNVDYIIKKTYQDTISDFVNNGLIINQNGVYSLFQSFIPISEYYPIYTNIISGVSIIPIGFGAGSNNYYPINEYRANYICLSITGNMETTYTDQAGREYLLGVDGGPILYIPQNQLTLYERYLTHLYYTDKALHYRNTVVYQYPSAQLARYLLSDGDATLKIKSFIDANFSSNPPNNINMYSYLQNITNAYSFCFGYTPTNYSAPTYPGTGSFTDTIDFSIGSIASHRNKYHLSTMFATNLQMRNLIISDYISGYINPWYTIPGIEMLNKWLPYTWGNKTRIDDINVKISYINSTFSNYDTSTGAVLYGSPYQTTHVVVDQTGALTLVQSSPNEKTFITLNQISYDIDIDILSAQTTYNIDDLYNTALYTTVYSTQQKVDANIAMNDINIETQNAITTDTIIQPCMSYLNDFYIIKEFIKENRRVFPEILLFKYQNIQIDPLYTFDPTTDTPYTQSSSEIDRLYLNINYCLLNGLAFSPEMTSVIKSQIIDPVIHILEKSFVVIREQTDREMMVDISKVVVLGYDGPPTNTVGFGYGVSAHTLYYPPFSQNIPGDTIMNTWIRTTPVDTLNVYDVYLNYGWNFQYYINNIMPNMKQPLGISDTILNPTTYFNMIDNYAGYYFNESGRYISNTQTSVISRYEHWYPYRQMGFEELNGYRWRSIMIRKAKEILRTQKVVESVDTTRDRIYNNEVDPVDSFGLYYHWHINIQNLKQTYVAKYNELNTKHADYVGHYDDIVFIADPTTDKIASVMVYILDLPDDISVKQQIYTNNQILANINNTNIDLDAFFASQNPNIAVMISDIQNEYNTQQLVYVTGYKFKYIHESASFMKEIVERGHPGEMSKWAPDFNPAQNGNPDLSYPLGYFDNLFGATTYKPVFPTNLEYKILYNRGEITEKVYYQDMTPTEQQNYDQLNINLQNSLTGGTVSSRFNAFVSTLTQELKYRYTQYGYIDLVYIFEKAVQFSFNSFINTITPIAQFYKNTSEFIVDTTINIVGVLLETYIAYQSFTFTPVVYNIMLEEGMNSAIKLSFNKPLYVSKLRMGKIPVISHKIDVPDEMFDGF